MAYSIAQVGLISFIRRVDYKAYSGALVGFSLLFGYDLVFYTSKVYSFCPGKVYYLVLVKPILFCSDKVFRWPSSFSHLLVG